VPLVHPSVDQPDERLRGQVDQRSTQAGQQVRQQSDDIRSVAQQLREQGKDGPAKLADQAAERAQKVGSWLEDSDGDQILAILQALTVPVIVVLHTVLVDPTQHQREVL